VQTPTLCCRPHLQFRRNDLFVEWRPKNDSKPHSGRHGIRVPMLCPPRLFKRVLMVSAPNFARFQGPINETSASSIRTADLRKPSTLGNRPPLVVAPRMGSLGSPNVTIDSGSISTPLPKRQRSGAVQDLTDGREASWNAVVPPAFPKLRVTLALKIPAAHQRGSCRLLRKNPRNLQTPTLRCRPHPQFRRNDLFVELVFPN
jgi:hypothetical protein